MIEALTQVILNCLDNLLAEMKLLRHFSIAFNHRTILAVGILTRERGIGEGNKEVRHLRITRVTLTRRGNDNNPPRGVREYDINDFIQLRRVREGTTAEFANFHCFTFFLIKSSVV